MRSRRSTPGIRFARDLLFVRCPRRLRRALRWHILRNHGVVFTQLALAAGAAVAPLLAAANPSGGQVAAGSVQIHSSVPTVLDIQQQSERAVINWQSFSIAAGETVNFVQPSLRSVTLNRVLGQDPSAIFGRLNANGTVMLVNPNGVVFGAGSRVDVGGLVATTADIRNDDFLAGRLRFGQASPVAGAAVVNAGHISIRDSGLAALVAPQVENSGVIEARLGRVALAGARSFALDFQGDGLLSFDAGSAVDSSGQPLVHNSGTLRAEGGSVLLTAEAVQRVVDTVINTSGVIEATSVGSHEGRIVLSGGRAGGVVVGGAVDASGRGAGEAGGTVQVTGQTVQVRAGTAIDVSGQAGGGEIALGSQGVASGFAGKSQTTRVEAGASLRADALGQGDGGNVTVWSADTTVFAGSLSARGGVDGGDGGFAEVSSLKNIGLTGSVDLRAPKGATGQLLLDPTDLRITDSGSGGSQDANAGDGQVSAGDANQGADATLNTISRGLLEGMAGNANITLQATGQITIDAMAGGRIDLATTAGHGFTLQSTQSGGIRFVDAQTEIRTQGGNITLEAQGIGSTLANIGKLTSNGGTVALRASGDIQLAGAINAGSGAVQVQSTVGSIHNGASAPVLSGASVELSARGGQIGSAGSAIGTQTARLGLEAGGSIHASNSGTLSDLSVMALHAGTGSRSYQVDATGLDLRLRDGSTVSAERAIQAGGLNLALSSDRTLELGTIDVGSGTATLSSRGGNLSGAAGNRITAGVVKLGAEGSDGNNGAIGSSTQSINTTTARLEATAGSGGAFVANSGALDLARLGVTGASHISASGSLTAGSVDAGSAALTLASGAGSVLDDGVAATRITAGALTANAGAAVGSASQRLEVTAGEFNANAASGGIHVHNAATASTLADVRSGNGAIDITTDGSANIGNVASTTSSSAHGITIAAAGSIGVTGGVDAGTQGDVRLSTTGGAITGGADSLIAGSAVALTATSGVNARTAASRLQVQAGTGAVTLAQTGSVSVEQIATTGNAVSLTSSSGNVTVGAVQSGASGKVTLTAADGSVLDDGDAGTRIVAKTVELGAAGSIGDASHAVQTKATELSVASAGNLYLQNSDSTLTSLSVDHRHATPGQAATLRITSPYLTFQVSDSGSAYALERVVGVPLSSLSFRGDQTLVVGQVQGAGTVSLTATQGDIRDDGNAQTRITAGGKLSLTATEGSLGRSTGAIDVNASQLALATHGDLYLRSLADLTSLSISSTHADTTTSHGMAISAPSLNFSVSDSAAGHHLHTLTDSSSLSLDFTSDRDITLGRVDVSDSGSASFTSTGGRLLDDGDKSTRVLALSTTLRGAALGAGGNAHLDLVTGQISATASSGGVYIDVPMPAGISNTTSTLTLQTITAAGPVEIRAREGDVSLDGVITAPDQAVSLRADQGSILNRGGYFGYSGGFRIGSGSLTLQAARSIGSDGARIWVDGSADGARLQAQAGENLFLTSGNSTHLVGLQAGATLSYSQTQGAVTVGEVDAGAGGTVSITASSGAIVDDGDVGTRISGRRIDLAAQAAGIGAPGAALAVDARELGLTASGAMHVENGSALEALSITRSGTPSGSIAIVAGGGQSFDLSDETDGHHLTRVASASPLAFSFAGQNQVVVGDIDVGVTGSVSLSTGGSVVDDGNAGTAISAGTVSLTAGIAGSIGASGSGNAISLEGGTALTLSAGRHIFVSSDAALADLSIASTGTSGTSEFGISAQGQTFAITDSGSTQSLDFSGAALGNFSFSNRKNIQVGAIRATGDVNLTTRGGGANSNISSDGGSGRIAGGRVLLTAASNTAGGGSIGSSGTALRVDTPALILDGSANVHVADAQNLALLDMTLSHGTDTTFSYGVSAGNLNSFGISDGSTQGLTLAVNDAIDFRYSVDRALSLGTIDAGTSSTGSIAITSRSAPTGTNAQINRGSGTLTGGSVTLSALGSNGGVGAGSTLSTSTENLHIASGGSVGVSNVATLRSLSLDARHNTSGSTTHSYAVSATGLTFSISDNTNSDGFRLANITQSGLDLTVKSDRWITATTVNTGATGKVTLDGSSIQGGSGASAGSPSITTGDLTLIGSAVSGYSGGPLYTAVNTLSSTLGSSLNLSNNGDLTLRSNTVGGSAEVASSSGSLWQAVDGLFTAPTLTLKAQQSLAGSGNTLATEARRLTLESGGDIAVANLSDLYALDLVSNHATPGQQNTISVQADRLSLTLNDSVAGDQYHLAQLTDSSGLDFTLRSDVALDLGTVDVQDGRSLGLYSTGTATSITNDGGGLLKAGDVTLSATGSVGAAGSSATRMQTDALGVRLVTGGDAYLDNAQDLSDLSLTSTQSTGGAAPVYQLTAPSLSFDITDDATTHLNEVVDGTGLNFRLDTRRDQAIGVVDVGPSGTVSLTSAGDILGDADSSRRLTAASITLQASQGGAVGSLANPIHLSAPLATFRVSGALNVESDTHIDRLAIHTTHPTAAYGGTYSVVSVPLDGPAHQLFTAIDSASGTALIQLDDPEGLAFSYTSDRDVTVGALDLGSTGTVALTSSGSILGDGDPDTQIQAAGLKLAASGAIGGSGVGNAIDATVGALDAAASGGGVTLSLHGATTIGSVSGRDGVALVNAIGDIALGSINAGGDGVTIDNQGGSILSGTISNSTTVSLTAAGSIGNHSAIQTSANGGTTVLTASASAAHGADGSIAVNESYNLRVASVTAPAGVTLNAGRALSVGTVSGGGAVSLKASQGDLTGVDGSNAISGASVDLSAAYGGHVGTSGTRLNVSTTALGISTSGNIYINGAADLDRLSIDRSNTSSGNFSSGTLSVTATNLTLNASDSGNTTTFTTLTDSTGLDFSYLGIGSIRVGTVDVGNGSALLRASLHQGDGSITAVDGSSTITAGALTLQANGTGSAIGSSGTALGMAVDSLTASSGTGGLYVRQAGSLNLSNLNTTGDMSVNATAGDLTLGSLSWGGTLNLNAAAGSLLAGGGTLAGKSNTAAVTLSAANGIGTELAPVLVDGSRGHAVSASVTGTGSLHLASVAALSGGLTTSVNDGATRINAAGDIRLASMTSGTDAEGNDIRVVATAGDITVVSVSAGGPDAHHAEVDLSANAGRILATSGSTLEGSGIRLHGTGGVGTSSERVIASSSGSVQVSSTGGDIYLGTAAASVLTSVSSGGGDIDIASAKDLLIANASSEGGAITLIGTADDVALIAGSINAGTGDVRLESTSNGGSLRDDGDAATRIGGATVTLQGKAGVGTASASLQTAAATLDVSSGNGIYLSDQNTDGVTLRSVVAQDGAVDIRTAGPTTATLVKVETDGAGRDISISTGSGDLTLGTVTAGATQGRVQLASAGSILGEGSGTHVSAHGVSLNAGGDIGAVADLTTGAGHPIKLDVDVIEALGTTGSDRVVSVEQVGTDTLTLGSALLSVGSGSSVYIQAGGDLDATADLGSTSGLLSLASGGTLTLPDAALVSTGAVRLVGATDVVTGGSGDAARDLRVNSASLQLRSGAAGGDTRLTTAVGRIDAELQGAGDLTLHNTGALTAATLTTSDGDISATSSSGLTVDTVVAGGSDRQVSLTATGGDLKAGTVDAGTNGSLVLTALDGSILGEGAVLTGGSLALSSASGIGSGAAAFKSDIGHVSAEVTGTGSIHLSSDGSLDLGTLSTRDGDIAVSAAGDVKAATISAGHGGDVSLASSNGGITLTEALALSGGALRVDGDATLVGGAHSLTTGGGALRITGTLTGSGDAATLDAGGGAVSLDGAVSSLAALTVTGGSIRTAGVSTDGAQTYHGATTLNGAYATQGGAVTVDGATQLGGATTVSTAGGDASFKGSVDGAADLAVSTGAGSTRFNGAVGQATRVGQLTVDTAGATRFGGAVSAASVTTDAAGTLALDGGSVDTTGAQRYGEAVTLGTHTTLTGQGVAFTGGIDGNANLTVDSGTGAAGFGGDIGSASRIGTLSVTSAGATTFDGKVRAASVTTDAAGTLAINGDSIDTTGVQTYGERAVLGTHVRLSGSTVTLAGGADGTRPGAQSLAIVGNAVVGGAIGAQNALASLDISGSTTLAGVSVTTTGDQQYGGPVQVDGNSDLRSTGGSLNFASTIDSSNRSNLSITSDVGAVAVAGAVGSTGAPGVLTVHAATTLDFSGSVHAYEIRTLDTSGLTRFGGTVQADGPGGISVSGANIEFQQAVTATQGALQVVNTSPTGTLSFAPEAWVHAATGFTQSGGAGITLPARVYVERGPITLEAMATLPSGDALIETEGDITITGLHGPATNLTLSSGHGPAVSPGAGALRIGLNDDDPAHKLDVLGLTVLDAGSARLYGRIGGVGGAEAATRIASRFWGDPYYMNDAAWAPVAALKPLVTRVTSVTVPRSGVSSTPGIDPLFSGELSQDSLAADALGVFLAPEVLTVRGDEGLATQATH